MKAVQMLSFPSSIIIFTVVIVSIIWKFQLVRSAAALLSNNAGYKENVLQHSSVVCIDFQFDA